MWRSRGSPWRASSRVTRPRPASTPAGSVTAATTAGTAATRPTAPKPVGPLTISWFNQLFVTAPIMVISGVITSKTTKHQWLTDVDQTDWFHTVLDHWALAVILVYTV